jgi:predicted dinucleotide-binding enzyme
MNYSIIGAGNVGSALARQFARNGIATAIANTRGPDSMAALTQELGSTIKAVSLQEAVKADVVILAVPYLAHPSVAAAAPVWSGKIVIDAMNTYGVPPEVLKGRASSDIVAEAFPGAKVVKTFNQLPAKLLARDPVESGGHRVMFVSSDDEPAALSVAGLVERLGFAPIQLGSLSAGGDLLRKGGPLVLQNLIKQA